MHVRRNKGDGLALLGHRQTMCYRRPVRLMEATASNKDHCNIDFIRPVSDFSNITGVRLLDAALSKAV